MTDQIEIAMRVYLPNGKMNVDGAGVDGHPSREYRMRFINHLIAGMRSRTQKGDQR